MSRKTIRMRDLASTPKRQGLISASASTILRWVRQGDFVQPFRLGKRITAWDLEAVEKFLADRAEVQK